MQKKLYWPPVIPIPQPELKQIFRVMKLTAILLAFMFVQVYATGNAQNITLSDKNMSLRTFFMSVKKQTGYVTLGKKGIYSHAKEVSVSVVNMPLMKVLEEVMKEQPLGYIIQDKTIVLYEKQSRQVALIAPERIPEEPLPPSSEIHGRITDSTGAPLAGASVKIKGTNIGTTTDANGQFTINAKGTDILIISFVGYEPVELPANSSVLNVIKLFPVENKLEDLVVVGYGTQKKASLTGAVSTVKSDELTKAPMISATNALGGRVPGLISVQSFGVPGDDAAGLSIRDFGPALVIVDGIETDFRYIDPAKIESITILKDASSAIYGSRAGNGVILVTTKRGTTGKPTFTLNSSYTLQGITDMPRTASAGQYAEMTREAYLNSGQPEANAPFTEEQIAKYNAGDDPAYPNTDWYKILIRPWGPEQQHNISVRGGSDAISYYGYLGYTKQESIFRTDFGNYQRYNFQSNIDAKILDNLKMQVSVTSSLDDRNFPQIPIYAGSYSSWGFLWQTLPIYPATLPDPDKISYANGGGTGGAHVITSQNLSGYNRDKAYYNNITLTLNYDFRFVPGLSFKVFENYAKYDGLTKVFAKPITFYTYNPDNDQYTLAGTFGTKASLTETANYATTLTSQLSLNYDKTFDKHHIAALGLYELISNRTDMFNASRRDFLTPAIDQLFAGSVATAANNGSASEMGRASFVNRLNYSFAEKYLLEFILRADASAKFPPGKQWGYFPAILLGWRLDKENFFNSPAFDLLKLRTSYGQSGYDPIGNFQYLSGYQLFPMTYLLGSTSQNGLISMGLANPGMTWEKMKTYNIGVDFSYNKRKLYGEADVFYRERAGILATRNLSLPNSFGANLSPENLNSMNTRGFDLKLGTAGSSGGLNWDISGNISWSRSKWEYYEEPDYTDPDLIRLVKQSGNWSDRVIGYVSDGLFTSQAQIDALKYTYPGGNAVLRPGDLIIKDRNGDGVLDWKDQQIIGKGTMPHWMAGLDVNLKYMNFDFSMLIQGAFGYYKQLTYTGGMQYYSFVYDERWTSQNNNKDALIPRLGGASTNDYFTDRSYVRSDYGRLKMMALGYTLPNQLLQKIKLQQVRLYLATTNLFTISGLKKFHFDPEALSGETGRYYPQQKTISFGANISF